MKLEISNSIRVEEPSPQAVAWARENLVFENPQYKKALALGKWTGNIEKEIWLYSEDGGSLVLPFGVLQTLWKSLPKGSFEYETHFSPFKRLSMTGDIKLYDYQENALNRLLEGKNGVLEAPCGSGKTQIGLALIKAVGGKALWLTHTRKLLLQSKERCQRYFSGDFGEITEGRVRIGKDITFATVQTMSKVDPNAYRDAFSCVVVDECHHCVGTPTQVREFYKIVSNCNCRHKYGMSATLTRSDGLTPALFALIGPKLHTIREGELKGKTIKARLIRVGVDYPYETEDYSGPDGMLDYAKMIESICDNGQRNALIAGRVESLKATRRKQLVLTARVSHAEALASMIPGSSLLVGKVSEKKRDYSAPVLVATYALAKEGLDIPELDALHLATPTKDPVTVKQSVGRVERNVSGKQEPIVLDYVDEAIPYCVRAFSRRKNILKK